MAGHSHAKTVRKKKEADAKKRGQIFSKMARLIWVAVKQGGPNPETNAKLRMAIEMARSYNMPSENIERAIKRATGEGEVEGEKLEEVSFEALGPGGVALIIEGITDNKNRAVGEVRNVLGRFGGKLVNEGGVKWMFERKGCITVNLNENKKPKEELELIAIDAGAEDILWHNSDLDIYCDIENLENLKKNLEEEGIKIDSITLDWKPKEMINLEEGKKKECLKLFEALDELDSVQEIYSNLKI